jgi:single-stranded DNA-binding protein
MASGATSHLWGFITSPDFKLINDSFPLLKFRLAFTRYDFQAKKTITDFIPVTAFSKLAEKINSSIHSGMNYICCHCDIRVSSFASKSGAQIQQQEHIVNDFRIFSKPKSSSNRNTSQDKKQEHLSNSSPSAQERPNSNYLASHSVLPDPSNTTASPTLDCSTSEAIDLDGSNQDLPY